MEDRCLIIDTISHWGISNGIGCVKLARMLICLEWSCSLLLPVPVVLKCIQEWKGVKKILYDKNASCLNCYFYFIDRPPL